MHRLSRRACSRGFVLIALAAAASPALGQAAALASGGAGALSLDSAARALVAAVGAPDPAARTRFLATTLAPARLAAEGRELEALLQRLHDDGGGLEIVGAAPLGRGIELTVRSRGPARLAALYLSPDRADPSRLGALELLKAWDPAADAVQWPSGRLAGDEEIARVIDRNVSQLAAAGAFSGVVLVARGDRVIFERGYGWADLEDSVANTPRTRFAIASIGKMFTAVAVAQLVEAGKLRLDDTLARVLPEYPNAERARRITIRHLLGHTAGLGNLWDAPGYDRHRDYASATELAFAVAGGPLAFEPGSRWAYSNEGYAVLAAVVEKASGERFDDYLRRHVWGPARMRETGNFGPDDVVPHRAVGYRPAADDPLRIRSPRANWSFVGRGNGAGGGYSTAGDLLRFSRALRAGTILGAALRDTLWTGRSPLPWDGTQRYGFGAIVSTVEGLTVIGHGGGGTGSGMDNELRFAADGAVTVIVLANADPPAASDLAHQLVRFLALQ
jgi:D-alanyl-D-alanine carboxypeptidase